jgi:hypothetical protein
MLRVHSVGYTVVRAGPWSDMEEFGSRLDEAQRKVGARPRLTVHHEPPRLGSWATVARAIAPPGSALRRSTSPRVQIWIVSATAISLLVAIFWWRPSFESLLAAGCCTGRRGASEVLPCSRLGHSAEVRARLTPALIA